jgi:DNA-directed RNA polymerase subunit RPC12/RpoP
MDEIHSIQLDACPYCGHQVDSASSLTTPTPPEPEDVSICIQCGSLMIYDQSMRLRRTTDDELKELMEYPDVLRTLRAWRETVGKERGAHG